MPKIGSFGGVTFEVSSKKILNFNDLSRSGDARWSNHDIMMKKPMPEFVGPGQENLSLKITLRARYGVNPEKELKKLRDLKDKGKTSSFVLGTKSISSSQWFIENLSESYPTIDGKGRVIAVETTLTLKEYPILAKKKAKPKTASSKKIAAPASKKKSTGKITIKAGMLNCRATASLKGKIVKVLRKNQTYTVYGIKKTDITWYDLGGGKWCSANSKYVSYKKG